MLAMMLHVVRGSSSCQKKAGWSRYLGFNPQVVEAMARGQFTRSPQHVPDPAISLRDPPIGRPARETLDAERPR